MIPVATLFGRESRCKMHIGGQTESGRVKNPIIADVWASVCCSCGHIELGIYNKEEVWQAYLDTP